MQDQIVRISPIVVNNQNLYEIQHRINDCWYSLSSPLYGNDYSKYGHGEYFKTIQDAQAAYDLYKQDKENESKHLNLLAVYL